MTKLTKQQIARLDKAAKDSGQDGTLAGCFRTITERNGPTRTGEHPKWLLKAAKTQWTRERKERSDA